MTLSIYGFRQHLASDNGPLSDFPGRIVAESQVATDDSGDGVVVTMALAMDDDMKAKVCVSGDSEEFSECSAIMAVRPVVDAAFEFADVRGVKGSHLSGGQQNPVVDHPGQTGPTHALTGA